MYQLLNVEEQATSLPRRKVACSVQLLLER